jgi:lipid II isoglutaminyl synthase (glutamine-hydrolysing)
VRIRIGHLYPELMNIYADRGNIIALTRRAQWRGIECEVAAIELGAPLDPEAHDLLFMGGGQDREQRLVCDDFEHVKGSALKEAAEADVAILAICGGYQLMGRFYRDNDGNELPGVGLFPAYTVPREPGEPRLIGNVVVEAALPGLQGRTLVGFENHGGRTHLEEGCEPLGRVRVGGGNNGRDGTEGAVCRRAVGTYLHGSLLPKNPWLADLLLEWAMQRHEPGAKLVPLDDEIEGSAHRAAVARAEAVG